MKLPLTVAALLLSVVTLAPVAIGQQRTCSCKSPDGSCVASVSCRDYGCTSICGARNGCYAKCGQDLIVTHFTLQLIDKSGKEIASALSESTGHEIEFTPWKPNGRFTVNIKDDDMWNALDYLYERGKVTVDGKDWAEYQDLRRAALGGKKLHMNFDSISVSNALAHLSFLTGISFIVKSGDAGKQVSLSLQGVTLDEVVARISAEAGVKIERSGRQTLGRVKRR